MILSILVIFSIVFYLNYRWKRRKVYKIADALPGSNGYPIFGHMFSFLRMNYEDNLNEAMRIIPRNLPIAKVWTGNVLFVVIESPELSHQLLNSSSCLKIPFMFSRPFLARYALPICNGEVWQRHRKILSHSFKVQVLNDLMPTINEKCQRFVAKMKSQIGCGEFNILHHIAALAMETTMKGSFYYDKDFYGNKLIDDMDRAKIFMIKRMARPWLNFEFFFQRSQLYQDIKKSFALIHQHVDEIIKLYETNRANGFVSGKMNIIDQLMSEKSNLTKDEIRDEIYIFLFAGYETSSMALAAVFLLIAIHKDVQAKVIEEVDELFDGENVSMENLSKFKYVDYVVKETLRLFPTIPIVPRKVTEDFQLNEYTIPKDTILLEFIYALHRNPQVWGEDVLEFKPERFAPENYQKIDPNAFVPFAGGRRKCIGYKYAMNFLKIVVIHFFKYYEVSSSLKYKDLTAKMTVTLEIAQKYMVSVQHRKKNVPAI
ncbi:hypothetical protein PVAND_006079 [Polypedilum vanderplanki]|uniref:Cytochrome P450 n=1 Tax=Polypedilum vanderplanki TaxID=319348 RepID=A0A9J6C3W4_POLVA|nr:hypothetical protein PVAND_006079 [Polypedilum vanderplanki]